MKLLSGKRVIEAVKRNYAEAGLLLAVLLGIFLRVWRIGDLPFPPNDSELFFGYYGWSLLHYHIDEFGTHWPINFPSIGDFKYPGLSYLNILPAAIFGLSFITARFWSVLLGAAFIPLIYLFSLLIFKNRPAALAGAFVAALSPWSLVLSRMGYENYPAMVISLTALVLLLAPYLEIASVGELYAKLQKYFKEHKKGLLIASFILFVVATFTYAAERLFVPAILVFLFALSFAKNVKLVEARKTFLVFSAALCTIVIVSLIPWQNRGRASSLVYDKLDAQEANRQEELIQESGLSPVRVPVFLTRLLHNKYRIFTYHLLEKYSYQFSPEFLFFRGDASYERIPDSGQLLLIEIILLPVGLWALFRKRNFPLSAVVLFWLFAAPLPATITTGSSINRSSLLIPPLILLSGLGLEFIVSKSGKLRRLLIPVLSLGFLFSASYSLYQIFVIKPIHYAWYTEVVNQQMVSDVLEAKNKYSGVVMPNDEYIYFLFYGKISPRDFLSESDIDPLNRQNPWDRVQRFSNIHFNMPTDCPKSGKEDVLYVCKGENVPQNSKILKVIRYRDGVAAYTFLTFYPISKMSKPLPPTPTGLKYMTDLETDPKRPQGIIENDSLEWW